MSAQSLHFCRGSRPNQALLDDQGFQPPKVAPIRRIRPLCLMGGYRVILPYPEIKQKRPKLSRTCRCNRPLTLSSQLCIRERWTVVLGARIFASNSVILLRGPRSPSRCFSHCSSYARSPRRSPLLANTIPMQAAFRSHAPNVCFCFFQHQHLLKENCTN